MFPASCSSGIMAHGTGEASDRGKGMDEAEFFFLYATHFAMVRLMNKTGALLLPTVSAVPFGLFLLMPLFCVFFSYQIGRLLRRFLPSLWCLLNGGR